MEDRAVLLEERICQFFLYTKAKNDKIEHYIITSSLFNVYIKAFLFINFFLITMPTHSQDLSTYQWKNRILIIFDDYKNSDQLIKQLQQLENHKRGLLDRKLVVFQSTLTEYRTGSNKYSHWLPGTDLAKRFKSNQTNFEVVLIGLDGGVKMRKEEIVYPDEIFGIIDKMPMRRAELRNKN